MRWRPLLILLSLALAALPLRAQPEAPPPSSQEIQAVIDRLREDASVEQTTKDAAIALYNEARAQAEAAERSAASAAEFRRATTEAPQLLLTIREELSKPAEPVQVVAPEGATLTDIEQRRAQAQAELQAARQQAQDLQTEATKRNERRPQLPALLSRARERLTAATDELAAFAPEGLAPELAAARRLLLRERVAALTNEVASLEAEAASYDARQELLPARRDRALRRVTAAEAAATAWQAIESARRQADAEAAAREAKRLKREAALKHPVLQEFAGRTEQLAARRVEPGNIPSRIDETTKEAARLESQLATLRTDYLSIRHRVEKSGLNRATGLLLRRQLEPLEDERRLRSRRARVQSQAAEVEYGLIELQDQRQSAGDIDQVVQDLLGEIRAHETEATGEPADLESVARDLAVARRDTLDTLINDSNAYSLRLAQLESALRELLQATERYRAFIEERILWVRSVAGDRIPRAGDFVLAAAWLLDPDAWRTTASGLAAAAPERWPAWLPAVALVVILWGLRPRLRALTLEIAERVGSYKTDALRLTSAALALTLLAAAPLPATIWCAGWILGSPSDLPDVAMAVSLGIQGVALALYPLTFLAQTVRTGGLAQAHFKWPAPLVQSIRRHLRWYIPSIIPVGVLIGAFDTSQDEVTDASLGRLCFSVGMLLVVGFGHAILRPTGPVVQDFARRRPGAAAYRLRLVWYVSLLLVPACLVVATWLGYYYTALQLANRLYATLGFALAVVVLDGLLTRWLFIARRRVAIEDARRRREQAQAGSDTAPVATEAGTVAFDEAKLDLPAISAQTVRLFRVTTTIVVVLGLFAIWAQVLPALRMLDRVQVLPSVTILAPEAVSDQSILEGDDEPASAQDTGQTNGAAPSGGPASALTGGTRDAGGGKQPEGDLAAISITLADLGLGVIILVVTWAAFRNLPALVEMMVLQRLPLDAGSRFALSTVLRYLIAIIGVVAAFNVVGVDWSRVQWLAAALTFGLAFGMQEIFANFVSGLIILAERPFRIGDTVTVEGVSGTVTRIRMRATTITDWDRKELVIPNRTFITGDVINWTLSDPVLRVTVPVGVSYGSDVDLVEKLLKEIAAKEPVVLKDPAPQAFFLGFGDSTLNFELRIFIPHVDHLVSMRHAMHKAIIKRFREADIEIAFPQRDLHIRSIGDLGKLVERRADIESPEVAR